MTRVARDMWPSTDGYALVLEVQFGAGQVTAVRRQVGQTARRCGMQPERVDTFVIAINEVMSNAVRHGGGRGRLRLWRDGDLMCQIDDQGSGFPASLYTDRSVRPTPSREGGMGLWLAQHTCDRLAIQSGPTGTTVYISALLLSDTDS